MLLLYLTAVLTVFVCSLYFYFTRTFNYWKNKNVVGPKPVPFFGNLKDSTLRKKIIGEVLKDVHLNYSKEKVVGIYRMTTPCLLIRDLDIIKNIMIKDFDLFIDRGIEISREGLGNNLFHSDGDTWQVLRNKFTPLFTSGKLKNMFYLLTERGEKFMEYVDQVCAEQPIQNVHSLLQRYTMSTISACAFGLDVNALDDKIDMFQTIDRTMLKTNFFQELDMMYPGLLKRFSYALFPKVVTDFFYDLVRSVIIGRNGLPTNRKDFMDLILEMRQQKEIHGNKRQNYENLSVEMTESIIAAQAFVFFAAGYETSSSTLTFMLYQLALNPEIQDKVHAEIDEILEKCKGELTFELLKEMTYTTKVFNETLRMYPIVDNLQRRAKADYKLPGTDVVVKKGQVVIVSVLGLHHDEEHYPDPEKFDPERFNVENSGNRHICAYLPFGTGPRNCIGMRFAKTQSMVCLVMLLSKYRIEPTGNTKTEAEFDSRRLVINPLGGMPLKIVRRQ